MLVKYQAILTFLHRGAQNFLFLMEKRKNSFSNAASKWFKTRLRMW